MAKGDIKVGADIPFPLFLVLVSLFLPRSVSLYVVALEDHMLANELTK